MQLKTILCECWRICVTGNALKQLEMILCMFGRICAIGNAFVVLHCWQELHFEISRQKLNRNVQKPLCVVTTHHTAKANLKKGSSWPLEAIPYGVSLRVDY